MKKRIYEGAVLMLVVLLVLIGNSEKFRMASADLFNEILALIPLEQIDVGYDEYLNEATQLAIDGEIDSVDISAMNIMNQVFVHNNDCSNACASNMILGIVSIKHSLRDSALSYLLNAEQLSDYRPELKPHINYYLALAFLDYDVLLSRDIILSCSEGRMARYDYSKFLNVEVSRQSHDLHYANSIYYSRLVRRSLDNQKKQHEHEMRLYHYIIVSVSLLLIIAISAIFFIVSYRRKTTILTESVEYHKNKFATLLDKYMHFYKEKCDKQAIYGDANIFLSELHSQYASLTSTDIAIIWLILLQFTKEEICSTLNITSDYYYQRRTNISKTLKLGTTRNLNNDLKSFIPEFLSEKDL